MINPTCSADYLILASQNSNFPAINWREIKFMVSLNRSAQEHHRTTKIREASKDLFSFFIGLTEQ